MRMFGVGLTPAVLVDATLVRILLVPAFGSGVHARAGPRQLVGAQADGPAARAVRHSRGKRTRAHRGCHERGRSACEYPFLTGPPGGAPRGSGELLRDEILDGATELLPATGTPE